MPVVGAAAAFTAAALLAFTLPVPAAAYAVAALPGETIYVTTFITVNICGIIL
eukprot:CAMPEP_0170831728 /NCGR_PEP_ID=MMETSP0733-20121128/50328_1 /TAXON_ID=186038 /ORGANISM="Fragilariopsis kerguelensis, Strain L26-C5" /LENGTH=52 /DNA_ID=CAMNT_0011197735 /DNA_START=68 /DNA_END=226 /DNA_ORIENTATION=-